MQLPQNQEEKVISTVKEFAESINSGRNVVTDMSALVDATSQLPLSNLGYWEKLIRRQFSSALESTPQPKWKLSPKPVKFLTWIDIISWDGYKREKTLRTLTGAAPNSFFFALALRRLNDWVPQVREAAREKLPEIADASNPNHVVDALCITLPHWNSWGRMDNADKRVLLEIISNERVASALIDKLLTATSGPMTAIFSQVGRTSVLDGRLDEIAKEAIQPALRAKAYRSKFEGKLTWFEGREWEWTDIRYCEGSLKPIVGERRLSPGSPFIETLRSAAFDSSPMVRRVAAEMLIRDLDTLDSESLQLADRFACDASPSVAERGRFALKRLKQPID